MQRDQAHSTPHSARPFRESARYASIHIIALSTLITLIFTSCQDPPDWINSPDDFPTQHTTAKESTSDEISAPSEEATPHESDSPQSQPQENTTIDTDIIEYDDSKPLTPMDLGLEKPKVKAFERPPETSPITTPPALSDQATTQKTSSASFFQNPAPDIVFLNDQPQATPPISSLQALPHADTPAVDTDKNNFHSSFQSSSQFSVSVAQILSSAENALSSLAHRQNSIASSQSSSNSSSSSSSLKSSEFSQSSQHHFSQSSSSEFVQKSFHAHSRHAHSLLHFQNQSSQSSSSQSSSSTANQSSSSSSPSPIPNPFTQSADSRKQEAIPPAPSASIGSPISILIPESIRLATALFQETSTTSPITVHIYRTDAEALTILKNTPIALAILHDTLLALPQATRLLKPIPQAQASILSTLDPLFVGHYFDSENKISIPIFYSSLAIAHRKSAFSRPIETWQEIITILKNPTVKTPAPTVPPSEPLSSPHEVSPSTSKENKKHSPPPPLHLLEPLRLALPSEPTLHPALWAKMQDLPQRRASTPPSWWPSSELITPDLSKANLIIEESHILLHITDPATWEITLPKEGTITRLYHITLPQHSAHPEETLSPIIETLFNPEFQKRLTNALSIASTIAQERKHATGHHPVIYPSMDILSQSVLAIPVIESAKSTEAHEE